MPKPLNPIKRVNSLYDQCLSLLEKEVKHLTELAIVEKLPTSPAKDLRDIIKLLGDMKRAQADIMEDKKAAMAIKEKEASEAALLEAIRHNEKPPKNI